MTVLCGIITFNREKLLNRCIKKLEKQTLKPNFVLIVNQGDETISFNSSLNIKIINQKNNGSAGGWSTAINYCLQNNFKYIWLMDDDGYPDKNSLELLTKSMKNEYSCLSSIVLQENQFSNLVFSMPIIKKNKSDNFFFKLKKLDDIKKLSNKNLYPFAHLFNGALINSKAIKKIGNVNKNFKMYGEEVDYFHRLKNYGPIFTLLNSYHFHPSVKKKFISHKNAYYLIRNSIINNNNYSKFKLIKNCLIILITLFRIFERNGFFSLIKFIFFNKNYFLKSIYDGYKKR